MKRFTLRMLAAAVMLVSAVAFAQDKPAPAKGGSKFAKPGPAGTAAPRVRNYDFDADFIDGELVRPEGEFLNARRQAEHGSLIRVRTDFIREIVKSAEDL